MASPNANTSSGTSISGHTLTASQTLIDQAPHIVSPPATWTTSHAEIERLFELSANLGLEGEITPVEAWNRIWMHPMAGKLTAQGLLNMQTELKQLICCYG